MPREPLLAILRFLRKGLTSETFGRLLAERKAGRTKDLTQPTPVSQIDEALTETLARLRGRTHGRNAFADLVAKFGSSAVVPPDLRDPHIQVWLDDDGVSQQLLKAARTRLDSRPDPNLEAGLRHSLLIYSGFHPDVVVDQLERILRILVAGCSSALGLSGAQLLSKMSQEGELTREAIRHRNAHFSRLLSSTGFLTQTLDQQVLQRLERIKRSRRLDSKAALLELDQLRRDIDEGELQAASPTWKAQVYLWTTRLGVTDPTRTKDLRSFLSRAMPHISDSEKRVAEALILDAENDFDQALLHLDGVESADARSTLFSLLVKNRGDQVALDWLQEEVDLSRHASLTGLGWCNAAVTLFRRERWEEAVTFLTTAAPLAEEWPDLHFMLGVAYGAQLLPVELRHLALELNVFHKEIRPLEGDDANEKRDMAIISFEDAGASFAKDSDPRLSAVKLWLLWLRLTSPNAENQNAARSDLAHIATRDKQAVDHIQLLLAFDIPFDRESVLAYLQRRRRVSTLSPAELYAEVRLKALLLPPSEYVAYLDEMEEALFREFPVALCTMLRIEAAVRASRYSEARRVLETTDQLGSSDRERFAVFIDKHQGGDPGETLLKLYERDHDLLDLRNLVEHLTYTEQWAAAAPYLEELLCRERTVLNARRLVFCLAKIPSTKASEVLATLNNIPDLVASDLELASARAWALFRAGEVAECEHLVRRLRRQRESADDLDLEINLALYTGNWEAFSSIIADAAPALASLAASTLYRLASLAAATDREPDRAMKLLRKAVAQDPADPELLANSAFLAFQLGSESRETSGWLHRARELSSESGPITTVALKTVIEEWMPRRTAHLRKMEHAWLRGDVPVHLARRSFNLPLIRLLNGIPNSNLRASDPRERAVIPIAAGIRTTKPTVNDASVTVDVSSLYVLHYLGFLELALRTLPSIILPADTFIFLLNEVTDVQFHQPSRFRTAEEFGQLVDDGRITVSERRTAPPIWLVEEVGASSAESLQSAQEVGGLFVHPLPLHRADSYGEELANLRDYGEYLISVVEFVDMLLRAGIIDSATYERAKAYLEAQGEDLEPSSKHFTLATPVLLDELALAYLQSSGVLTAIAGSEILLQVHEEVIRERATLRAAYQEGADLSSTINKVRLLLREAMHDGKVKLMSRESGGVLSRTDYDFVDSTLLDILSNHHLSDMVLIDDRFSNKTGILSDGVHNTPVVSSVGLLDQILNTEARKRYLCHQQMRAAGYAFVPITADELGFWLPKQELRSGKNLPYAEFRTIRQSLANIRGLELFGFDTDRNFLNQMQVAAISTVRDLWSDEELSIETIEAAAELILFSLCPSPWHWLPAGDHLLQLSALFLAMMAQPLPIENAGRLAAFAEWIESHLISPILPANQHVVALSAEIITQAITAAIEDLRGTDRQAVSAFFVDSLARSLGRAICTDLSLHGRLGLRVHRVVALDGMSLSLADLIESARRVLRSEHPVSQEKVNGFGLQLKDDRLSLVSAEGSVVMDVSELFLLSSDLRLRELGLSNLVAIASPYPPPEKLAEKAKRGPLSPSELEELLPSVWRGPKHFQYRLSRKFQASTASWADLVPSCLDELEAAYGPLPKAFDYEQYVATQLSPFNAALLEGGSADGLRLLLEGYWRDDLRPSLYLSGWRAEDLLGALREADPFSDPITLLGAVEAILAKPFSEAFSEFSNKAVRALCSETFHRREDGSDTYQLLSTLVKYVSDRVSLVDGAPSTPPFWRSMVALRHSSRILGLLSGCSISVAELTQYVDKGRDSDAWVVGLIDGRVSPRIHFWTSDPVRLRAEVFGRLRLVLERVTDERYGEVVELFRTRQEELSSRDTLLSFLPGPLDAYTSDGSARPTSSELAFPEDSGPADQIEWALIASSNAVLSETHLRSLGEALRRIDFSRNTVALGLLQQAAIVAASHRDADLAGVLGDLVIRNGDEFSGDDSYAAASVLTIAAASHQEEGEWYSWLSERLARLARRVRRGEPAERLGEFLESVQRTANLAYPVYARAAAVLDSVK